MTEVAQQNKREKDHCGCLISIGAAYADDIVLFFAENSQL